jgi:hypothetical protein
MGFTQRITLQAYAAALAPHLVKHLILLFVLIGFASSTIAADTPKQITKAARKFQDIKAEVKQFYLHLFQTDPGIQQQVKSVTAGIEEKSGGVHPLHRSPPNVVKWFPVEENWNASTGLGETIARYLVFQTFGYAQSKHSEDDTALISEFEVVERQPRPSPTISTKRPLLRLPPTRLQLHF